MDGHVLMCFVLVGVCMVRLGNEWSWFDKGIVLSKEWRDGEGGSFFILPTMYYSI